jgi:hypothetical protein
MRLLTSSFFYMNQTHIVPEFSPKIFLNSVLNLRKYSYLKLFPGVWYPAELCSAGSDTPQDFVRWSIRPRRTLFCGVSDPAEQASAIKYIHLCHCSAGYDTFARISSAGSDTPQDLVLRGLIPRRILFCGVSDPTGKLRPHRIRQKKCKSLPFSLIVCMYKLHYPRLIVSMLKESPILKMVFCSAGYDTPRNHFWIWTSRRIRNRNQKYFGAWIRGLIQEKNQRPKISCNYTF